MRTGNVRWTAPELIAPEHYNMAANESAIGVQIDTTRGVVWTARPTKASDVYSFACLCVEVSILLFL